MITRTVDPSGGGPLLSTAQIALETGFRDPPTGVGMLQTKTAEPRLRRTSGTVPAARRNDRVPARCAFGSGTVSEDELVSLALALLPEEATLSPAEEARISALTTQALPRVSADILHAAAADGDPLGVALSALRAPETRRKTGQVFTPPALVQAMLGLAEQDAEQNGEFAAIVDPGAGTGRFLLAAAARWPNARLIAVESDPVCALLLRANAAVQGVYARTTVLVGDFLQAQPALPQGRVLFVGNPPYVRHHDLGEPAKAWYVRAMDALGVPNASRLAGLHVYFFTRTAQLSRAGDLGIFVTAAEWMETGYGKALRNLLDGELAGSLVQVVDPRSEPFPGVMTTAAVTVFHPHTPPRGIAVEHLTDAARVGIRAGTATAGAKAADRGTGGQEHTIRPIRQSSGTRVGDLFRVSRGQVTGCNRVWIAQELALELIPERYLMPCLTAARELFECFDAGAPLQDASRLKRVVDLPPDLTTALSASEYRRVLRFLTWAVKNGADQTYIAKHRSPWWAVRLHAPPPLVCTYMARRPPAFVLNAAAARLLNIAHGLYPRFPFSEAALAEAADALNRAATAASGRIYAGGLAKFEPGMVADLVIDWHPEQSTGHEAAA